MRIDILACCSAALLVLHTTTLLSPALHWCSLHCSQLPVRQIRRKRFCAALLGGCWVMSQLAGGVLGVAALLMGITRVVTGWTRAGPVGEPG